ncbi:acyl-CoA dehydrogenase family protein [Flavisphingomonas formosensis]|uniref:acyl-CoA dehydrogenase family protein n=1 Tax=Flavisphingomonas formosensis TaxID=861534 RepID=UPI0012FB41B6|nr:acyl-CoA dehydrogenase family protein [Sphingomonas formosensis]
MDFAFSDDLLAIRDQVERICDAFDDEFWRRKEKEESFPFEFHRAMADAGFLGITMPEEFGGSGLGVTAAAVMMNAVTRSAGTYAAASTIHINLFGPHPIVVFGTPEQKRRWIPDLIAGRTQVCFGVTEPDAGLDTTRITTRADKVDGGYLVNGRKLWTSTAQVAHKILLLTRTSPRDPADPTAGMTLFYTDLDRSRVEVQRIPKMGRAAVDSNATFFDNLLVPEEDRVGEEGKGFRYLLHSLNPERILVASDVIGIGQRALAKGADYARTRVVFDRPIGQNQSIQHPLAQCWADLEAAWLLTMKAAWLYDSGRPCGAEANAAKLLGGQAGHAACLQAVMTHGGMGYAKEYNVERYLREVLLGRLTPVSEQMILSFIGEKVLGLPKSY